MKNSFRFATALCMVSFFLIVTSTVSFACPGGNIIYVDQNASGANDGSSWTDAFTDFQEALDSAHVCVNINTMYVAKGVYRPTREFEPGESLSKTFYFNKNLEIYGGFLGVESNPSDRPTKNGKLNSSHYSVLNGDLAQNDEYNTSGFRIRNIFEEENNPDNAIHITVIEGVDSTMILDGFHITGGHANGASGNRRRQGGGMYIKGDVQPSSPIIRNCQFNKNIAEYWGGALLTYGDVEPQFVNCQFTRNISYFNGGAIFNSGENGFENRSEYLNCEFEGNEALLNGGVAINVASGSDGKCNPVFIQCIFSGNKAASAGVSFVNQSGSGSSDVTYLNCAFAGNQPTVLVSKRAGSMTRVYNSIIYGNELKGGLTYESEEGGQFDFQYTNIQNVPATGTNYNFNPFFVNQYTGNIPNTKGNYQIDPCIAATDLGNNTLYTAIVSNALDYDLNPRFQEGGGVSSNNDPALYPIDLGPWEYESPILFTATKDSTDAYIDLHWEANVDECNCFDEDPVLKRGVTIELRNGFQLIDSWEVYKENVEGGTYTFDYRHPVGPDTTIDYTLEFKRTGPGTLNCKQIERGSTLPFRQIDFYFINTGQSPNVVRLKWTNKSTLTDKYNIFRNGNLIQTIDADNELDKNYQYNDFYIFDDPNSFVCGEIDTYCIQTISDIYTAVYNQPLPEQVCSIGYSRLNNFQASDNLHLDKVVLTWNSFGSYPDQIKVVRDGEIIGVLDKNATTFEDLSPIFGYNSLYGIELVKNNIRRAGYYDYGMAPPNGIISGKVLTAQQKVPVSDVKIMLTWEELDSTYIDSTITNYLGEFEFQDLYYGVSNTFSLTASKGAETFDTNPIEVDLNLTDSENNSTVFFMEKEFEDEAVLDMTISFSATPDSISDKVDLVWSFQKNNATDTVFFNLLRGSSLIKQEVNVQPTTATINYSLEDLTGVPHELYDYNLIAYTNDGSEITDTTLVSAVNFPPVASPDLLFANPDLANGTVDLQWTHSSTNFKGFRVYRDDQAMNRIYQGPPNPSNTIDSSGIPGASTDYFVTAFRRVDSVYYESIPLGPVNVTYPALTPINSLTATSNVLMDLVKLEFTMPANYTSNYSYEGVRILRSLGGNEQVIAAIDKALLMAGAIIEYNDFTGIPLTLYDYEVRPYVLSLDSLVEEPGMVVARTFPRVSFPQDLTAIAHEGKIELNWRSPHTSTNTDGFIIYKGTGSNPDSIGIIPYQFNNTFNNYTNNPPNNNSETYQVRTVRFVDGVRYLSTLASVVADPPLINGDEAVWLKDFIATKDQAHHIKICWDWCSASIQSPFILRREGLVLDTLPYTARSYYDYGAAKGEDIEYSIETPGVNGMLNYQLVYTIGRSPSMKTVYGRAYKSNSHRGLINRSVRIELENTNNSNDKYIDRTFTNASGFYQFTNLPVPLNSDTYVGLVVVDSTNSNFVQNPQALTITSTDSSDNYEINFIDQYIQPATDNEIAQIDSITASPDPENMAVHLSWSPTNENFDGFAVYRGTTLLGEVLKGETLIWTDKEGLPGVPTLYAVRAFRAGVGAQEYSEYAYTGTNFPILAPVEYLTATRLITQNKLLIQWSHPYDNHDIYTITRNGDILAHVNTGDTLIVVDTSGTPGTLYNYEVIAWKGNIPSLPRYISAQYAEAEVITGFSLTAPDTSVRITTSSPLTLQSENHLLLEWDYAQNAADQFMITRYVYGGGNKSDERVLARVDGSIRQYKDYSGQPNQLYYYQVIPLIIRNDVEYIAQQRHVWAESHLFPLLHPPTNFDIVSIDSLGILELSFNINFDGIDGYRIYRDSDEIYHEADTNYGHDYSVTYRDKTAIPETNYDYTIECYSTRLNNGNEQTFFVDAEIGAQYPDVPTPIDFNASEGTYPNKIELTWTYNHEVPIDRFVLRRDDGSGWLVIDENISPGTRTYYDFDQVNSPSQFSIPSDDYYPIAYELRAVNENPSENKFSDAVLDTGSLYSGIVLGPDSIHRLGISVDIDGDWAVAGTEGDGFQIYRLYDDFTWRLDTFFGRGSVLSETTNDKFGRVVSISGKYIAVSAWKRYSGIGGVYIFERVNDRWRLQDVIEDNITGDFNLGWDLDIHDNSGLGAQDYLVFSCKTNNYNGYPNKIRVHRRNGTSWDFLTMVEEPIIGNSVAVHGDRLVATSDNAIEYYQITSGGLVAKTGTGFGGVTSGTVGLTENWIIAASPGPGTIQIRDIDNDEISASNSHQETITLPWSSNTAGDFAIAGKREGTNCRVYRWDGSDWSGAWIHADPMIPTDNFGHAVAVTQSHYMIGAYDVNNEKGAVIFERTNSIPEPENVQASDGTQPGQVLITWDEPNDLTVVSGYSIIRDGDLLASVASVSENHSHSYADLPASGIIPGKHYSYQVVSTFQGSRSKSIGDEGWMPANGVVEGVLTTLLGGAPVEGATVTARTMVDGDYLEYTTMTDNLGAYKFDELYYGEESVYAFSCSYLDHDIVSQTSVNADPPSNTYYVTLDINANSFPNASFYDKTAYAISGNIRHADIEHCFLEDIVVKRIYSINQNGNRLRPEEEKKTDENGNYTFIVNPETADLDSILIIPQQLQYINEVNGQAQDSICYNFKSVSKNSAAINHPDGFAHITNFNLDKVTKINFQDETKYTVTINVVNTCGDRLLNPNTTDPNTTDKWTIRASSVDGCFETTFKTGANGKTAQLALPPRAMVFTVTDVSDYSIGNLKMLNYLISNPQKVFIDSVHIKKNSFNNQTQIDSALTINIEYHELPIIEPNIPSDLFACHDPGRQIILEAGKAYNFPISVTELFSVPCQVTSGYLKVINGASTESAPVILEYNDELGKFEDYSFEAGAPNPVSPHRWNFKIEYYSDADVFQGEYSHAIFVGGSINLPGNGIITKLSDDANDIPLPLFVLRDPPGDGSFSSIKSGFTSTSTFALANSGGTSGGIYGDVTFNIAGAGANIGFSAMSGSYFETTKELSLTTTLSQEISTSSATAGRTADVIVGAGVAMQYGVVDSLSIECSGDVVEVQVIRSVGFTPIAVNTTWSYTRSFIESLIANYERDLILLEGGSLKLQNYDQQGAIDLYTTLRDNWQQILHYYEVETHPVYHLINTDYTDESLYPKMEFYHPVYASKRHLNDEANKWRDRLRQDIAANYSGVFMQNELDRYNNAGTAIRELMHVQFVYDSFPNSAFEFNGAGSNAALTDLLTNTYDSWYYHDDRYDDTDYYLGISGILPNEMAENRTFSGGITQQFTYGQSRSFNTTDSRTVFFDGSFNLASVFQVSVNLQTAPFGIGFEMGAVKFNNTLGAKTTFNYTNKSSTSESNTIDNQISYTLFDNEFGDEFSTTVVKGITLNHTPSFQLVGGKTSCPHEEGTLEIDKPFIQVVDPTDGSATNIGNAYFQDPDLPAQFVIKITNKSVPKDTRSIEVLLDNNSNPFGAEVRLSGDLLGEKVYDDIEADSSLILILTVSRGVSYEYEGLRILVRPACGDDRFEQANVQDTIRLNVYFQSPCSPVSIVSPSNNWLINGSNPELVVTLRDYEPLTPNFEGITLQYRKLDGGVADGIYSGWRKIHHTFIKETEENNNPVLPSVLEEWNNTQFGQGVTPEYYMVWQPDATNNPLFTDGTYELRAVSTCKEGTITNHIYSNVIRGVIDRSRMQVFGTPEPADGIWVQGDQVSVTFNKNVDCSLLLDAVFVNDNLRVFIDDTVEINNATFTCLNNKVIMTVPNMAVYDGKIMRVVVDQLTDENGNFAQGYDLDGNLSTIIEWDFLISTRKAYWEDEQIVIQLYEGDTLDYITGVRNTQFQASLSNISLSRTAASATWLKINPSDTFNINPGAVKPVDLTFIAPAPGEYVDTLLVQNVQDGNPLPRLPIKLISVKRPPYPPDWEVDGNLYPNSMTVVANYKIDGGPVSTDTLDQITAWIDNTLRGVGRIRHVANTFVAYITVYGSVADDSTKIEFRVWDQSTDTEYDANVADSEPAIIYGDNLFNGSTFAPRILLVDTSAVRYIHLNQGFTWISFNSVLEDMSINHVLSGLTNLTGGDQVLTQNASATYLGDTIGWYSDTVLPLDSFSTEKTYMVYLQNGPDSIRMTGSPAPPISDDLNPGANWVGFPSQGPLLLEDAISGIPSSDSVQIRSKDESRIFINGSWSSGLLTTMVPNGGYKLFLENTRNITIPDSIIPSGNMQGGGSSRRVPADPNNASTWNISADDYHFTDVIPLVGKIMDENGTIAGDGNKKVAAFINGDLRGVGLIENIGVLNDSLFSILIGKDDVDNGAHVKFYFFDGTSVSDSMSMSLNLLTNGGGLSLFNYLTPLIWNLDVCPDHLLLTLEDSPLSGLYEARQTILVIGNVLILDGAQVILNAPDVTIDGMENQLGGELEVLQTGCD